MLVNYVIYHSFKILKFFCICSLLKKLAEKGCWDIAEVRAKMETKLMEYLVICIHIVTINFLVMFIVYVHVLDHEGIYLNKMADAFD